MNKFAFVGTNAENRGMRLGWRMRISGLSFGFVAWVLLFSQQIAFAQTTAPAAIPTLPATHPAQGGNQWAIRKPQPFSYLCKLTLVDGALRAKINVPSEDMGITSVVYGDFLLLQINNNAPSIQIVPLTTDDGSTLIDSIEPSSTDSAITQLTIRRILINKNLGGTTMIIFIQRPPTPAGARAGRGMGPYPVGFSLSIRNPPAAARGGAPIRIAPAPHIISSQDFSHFIQEHPDETNQYLRPILRSFQCEYLVAPTEWELVQLFPEAFKPDDATVKETKSLLEKLDSDSPEEREAASARLKEIGPVAAAILTQIDPQTLSPEQAARVAVLLKDRLADKDVAEFLANADFLIDCLEDQRLAVRKAGLGALKKAVGHDVSFDFGIEDSIARSQAVEALRSQLKPATRP